MLLFIDQQKHIRVMRSAPDGSGTMKRERLGLIAKNTFEPSPELESATQPEEKEEVLKAIEMYRAAQDMEKRAAALTFPETMRVVLEYLEKGATDFERKMVVSALMEGVRLVRKAAKIESSQDL